MACVGDDDQCLVEGTLVTMADGSRLPIESLRAGDMVLSSYGDGELRGARVVSTFSSSREEGVRISLASGRELISDRRAHRISRANRPLNCAMGVERRSSSSSAGPARRPRDRRASGIADRDAGCTAAPVSRGPAFGEARRPPRDAMFACERQLRRGRPASSASSSQAGPRHERRGTAQLRRQRGRHPQLDLRLARSGRPQHPRIRRSLPRGEGRASSSRTTARPRRSSTSPTR